MNFNTQAMQDKAAAALPAQDLERIADGGRDITNLETPQKGNPFKKVTPVQEVVAKPYEWIDLEKIPPREWLYGHHFIRGNMSLTIAAGGLGKSSLLIGEALALVSGKRIFDVWAWSKCRVWYWNLEDGEQELQRKIQATCKRHGISKDDIADRLFINGRKTSLCTAKIVRGDITILTPVYDKICAQIKANNIDVLIVDPFVSSHGVTENDNVAIDAVAKAWARVAHDTNCAIGLSHHARKENGGEVTADSARGGVALVAAAREARVLNRMTAAEGVKLLVDNHKHYFRVQSDKANLAPIEAAQWYRFEGVDAENQTRVRTSDNIGVPLRFYPKDPFDDVTKKQIADIQERIGEGNYRWHKSANGWAGYAIADILGRNPKDDEQDKAFIDRVLNELEKSGQLIKVTKQCPDARSKKPFYDIGEVVS